MPSQTPSRPKGTPDSVRAQRTMLAICRHQSNNTTNTFKQRLSSASACSCCQPCQRHSARAAHSEQRNRRPRHQGPVPPALSCMRSQLSWLRLTRTSTLELHAEL